MLLFVLSGVLFRLFQSLSGFLMSCNGVHGGGGRQAASIVSIPIGFSNEL